jgi:uncharacterized protein YacL
MRHALIVETPHYAVGVQAMTIEFAFRIAGMFFFAVLWARLGTQAAQFLNLDVESRSFIFGLAGVLFGLIMTPWFTIRPVRALYKSINEMPIDRLLMTVAGAFLGLTLALLSAYPFSLLPAPFNTIVPPTVAVVATYLGMSIFGTRSREISDAFLVRFAKPMRQGAIQSNRRLLLDTSVLIDGRIVDVAETGFIGGILVVPRFVLNELHRVADSSEMLRRNRGRRGLDLLKKLQQIEVIEVTFDETEFEEIPEVDHKLIALAQQTGSVVVTNDFNLNQVAEAQGVSVLNINVLANALRPMYIPDETLPIRLIQEGRDPNQAVGYLDDGTMVVVENGKMHMDRTIIVRVTKLINRPTGRMIFAVPDSSAPRPASAGAGQ